MQGKHCIVETLLAAGADVFRTTEVRDRAHSIFRLMHMECAIDTGASVAWRCPIRAESVRLRRVSPPAPQAVIAAPSCPLLPRCWPMQDGCSTLLAAAVQGHDAVVRTLLGRSQRRCERFRTHALARTRTCGGFAAGCGRSGRRQSLGGVGPVAASCSSPRPLPAAFASLCITSLCRSAPPPPCC